MNNEHLSGELSIPLGSESHIGQNSGVRLKSFEGQAFRIALQNQSVVSHAGVVEEHSVPLLGEAAQDNHRRLIYGCEDILSFEVGLYLQPLASDAPSLRP